MSACRFSSVIFLAHSTLPAASRRIVTPGLSTIKLSDMAFIGIDKLPAWKIIKVSCLLEDLHPEKSNAKMNNANWNCLIGNISLCKKSISAKNKKIFG